MVTPIHGASSQAPVERTALAVTWCGLRGMPEGALLSPFNPFTGDTGPNNMGEGQGTGIGVSRGLEGGLGALVT